MTTEDSTQKNEAREGEMVGAESPFSQTQKSRVVNHKRVSGNCADCRKFLAGHWIKVYPDGKKEDYPYGYCRDPRGERGLCMVFRPKEETLFEITRVNMTLTRVYSSSELKLQCYNGRKYRMCFQSLNHPVQEMRVA